MQFINRTNHTKINRRVWEECQHYDRPSLCHRPELLAQLCASFPINLIKAVELPVRDLISLLTKKGVNSFSSSLVINEDEELKIIYLVRDPRGTLSSRAKLDWCQANPKCREPYQLCAHIEEDIDLLGKHLAGHNNSRHYLLILKFENLAINVKTETEKLFRFLELPVTELTRAFLDSHTESNQTNDNDPFSTVRQSNAVAHGWKTKLKPEEIDAITEVCTPLLKKLDKII
jgi:hypothetical protein